MKIVQPHPGECVRVEEDHEGVQPSLFQQARKNKGQVQTGSQPTDHLVREAYSLALRLETRRWVDVAHSCRA